jgi:hypothetical protein
MKVIDLLLVILLIILVIILGKDLYRYIQTSPFLGGNDKNKVHKYYVYSSDLDTGFVSQVGKILSESLINKTHKLEQVFDKKDADTTIRLVPREEMERLSSGKVEYYPGTKKRIFFSWTYTHETPRRILIDANNWNGVPESGLSVSDYRLYVIRHEMMHALGYDHVKCDETTAPDGICPVLFQSTRGCPNGFKCGYEVKPADYSKKLFGIF